MTLSFKGWSRGFAVASLLLVSLCLSAAESFGVVGNVERDYLSNHVLSDSVWFYKDEDFEELEEGGGVHPPVEFDNERAFNVYETLVDEGNNPYIVQKVAYTRGTGGSVELTFYNPQSSEVAGTFQVNGAQFVRMSDPNNPISMSATGTQALTIPPYSQRMVTVEFSGFPNYVTYGYLRLNLIYYNEQGTLWSTQVAQNPWRKFARVYLTLSAPTDNSQQEIPWVDVLEDACLWADGLGDAALCASALTNGLFHSAVFFYYGVTSFYFKDDTANDDGTAMYRLRRFFDDRAENVQVAGDCRDSSGYLSLLMNAIGVSRTIEREWATYQSNRVQFRTNLLCPTGWGDWTVEENYGVISPWNFHQINRSDSTVYDACLALFFDLSGDVFMDAIAGWSPMGPPGYWQAANPNADPPYVGLVDGPAGQSSMAVGRDSQVYTIDRLGALSEN